MKFQEVFAEPTPPTRSHRAHACRRRPLPLRIRARPAPISFVAPPPARRESARATAAKALDAEKRYSDTEGIDTYPESELEFNPDLTDVTKVFVEAAPVAFKGDATGKFRKFVMGAEQPDPTQPPASNAQSAEWQGPRPRAQQHRPRGNAGAPARRPSATPASERAGRRQRSLPARVALKHGPQDLRREPEAAAAGASPALLLRLRARSSRRLRRRSRQSAMTKISRSTATCVPSLREWMGRRTGPRRNFRPAAANDEAAEGDADDEGGLGDIYAKAVPRPRQPPPPPPAPPSRATPRDAFRRNTYSRRQR